MTAIPTATVSARNATTGWQTATPSVLSVSARDIAPIAGVAASELNRLEHAIRQAAGHRATLREATHQLDERLGVAAQVLIALQNQVDRIESAVEAALAVEARNSELLRQVSMALSVRNGPDDAESTARS